MHGNGQDDSSTRLSKRDTLVGGVLVVAAQLACASTASCIHALPAQTPSVLRGLWRQTLTTLIFTPLVLSVCIWNSMNESGLGGVAYGNSSIDEETPLIEKTQREKEKKDADIKVDTPTKESCEQQATTSPAEKVTFVVMAMAGAALLNDTMVVALKCASSAAVMCLINTTPIWLILYSIVTCNPPGLVTLLGAGLSIIGAIVCAAGGGGDSKGGESGTFQATASNEELGSIIATIGALGGAMYMTACRRLSPLGIHPVILIWIINVGMTIVSSILCVATIEGGISLLSTDMKRGFFGFMNPAANPAAFFQSVFPDCFGSFGIMLSLGYFEPLIVSMIMLTEPLNASLISMAVVHEAAPSSKTIVGVLIVLVGCAIVLWESSKDSNEACELEKELERDVAVAPTEQLLKRVSVLQERRRGSQVVLLSPIGTFAPDVTAKAAWRDACTTRQSMRMSLTPHILREISMSAREATASSISPGNLDNQSSRRFTMQSFSGSFINRIKRSSWLKRPQNESLHEEEH